jgi:hypothetical protein
LRIERFLECLVLQQQRVHRIRVLVPGAEQPAETRRLLAVFLHARVERLHLFAELRVLLLQVRQLLLIQLLEALLCREELVFLARDFLARAQRAEEPAQPVTDQQDGEGRGRIEEDFEGGVREVGHTADSSPSARRAHRPSGALCGWG